MLADLRVRVFERLEAVAPAGLPVFRRGDLVARFVDDVDSLQDVVLRVLQPFLVAALVGRGTVAALWWFLPQAGLVLLVALVLSATAVPWLTGRLARREESRQATVRGELTASVVDLVEGAPELLVMGSIGGQLDRIEESDGQLRRVARRGAGTTGIGLGLTTALAGLASWGALTLGVDATHAGSLNGALLAVLALVPLAAFELSSPLPAATQALQRSRVSGGAGVRGHGCASGRERPDDPRRPGRRARTCSPCRGSGPPTRAPGAPRCEGWTCSLRPGRRVALVGPSGAGKSTLADVLVRFLPADAGEATLDGVPLERLAADDVRQVVGLVEQSPHLFEHDAGREPPGRSAHRHRRRAGGVLTRVGLGPWLAGLPDGLATAVGPTGGRLSGGQRQRVAVARALLADFPILVLDEPGEHLDPPAADALTADLLALTEGHSTLLITHRLTGLERVDEIVVLDEGRVVERGTHSDLVMSRRSLCRPVVGRADERSAPSHTAVTLFRGALGRPQRRERHPVSLDLARWQFASTSIYHFLFVPVTIGLAFLVALLETAWYRNDDETYRRLARFFGSLLLINVAVGVVTGLIQEFEFGMNWSAYSRLVGNVFGGPLAMEGLAAFFLESTFLGIWIFGWNRISKKAHLACIWMVAAGTMLSAAFIMAANSWMQHPVGYSINNGTHQPQLNNIWALFTNPVFLWGYTHVVLASLVTGAAVMLAVSAWHLHRKNQVDAFRRTAVISLVVLLPTVAFNLFVGSELGVVEGTYQPMKIAAAEALVDHLRQPLRLLALPDRRRQQRRDPHADLRGPRPALHPGHQPRRRNGAGSQQPQCRVPEGIRAGGLHPQRVHSVLVDAGDGLPGLAGLHLRTLGSLAPLPATARPGQMVPTRGALGGDLALPDQHRRLDAHRERPPAVDRPGPHVDQERRVRFGLGHRHLDLADRLLPDLRRARRSQHLADDPLRPPIARRGSPGQAHADPDDGSGTSGTPGSAPSATAGPDSSHEDEDDLALVY